MHVADRFGIRVIDAQLASIEPADRPAVAVESLRILPLGAVQDDYGPESLPNLTGWLSEELSPIIDQFESMSIRDDLRRKLDSVVAKGRLSTLHNHLNSKKLIKQDKTARKQAAREFAEAALKIEQLASKEFQQDALRTGWSITAGGSMTLAIVTIAVLVVW